VCRLEDRVDPLRWTDAGVHGLTLDLDGERRDALAGRDQRAVGPGRLQPHGEVVLGGQRLNQGAAERRADLLVWRADQGDSGEVVEAGQVAEHLDRLEPRHHSRLVVGDPGSVRPPAPSSEWTGGGRALVEHRVHVGQQ
jgi:hypothetical protein